jgi:L-threonylcarbamoyladenylate synthase
MKVLKATKTNITAAAEIVKKGGLVIYPTETVYGLGCDPLNIDAVQQLLTVKSERNKPLPILASGISEVDKIAFISSKGRQLATRFWPGPLTMVFPKKPVLPDVVTFGWDSVGLRIPCNDVALDLIRLAGGLLVGSSANISGEAPPRAVQELSRELKSMVDVILDCGATVHGMPSTVADLTSENPKILRKGPVSLQELLDALAFGD